MSAATVLSIVAFVLVAALVPAAVVLRERKVPVVGLIGREPLGRVLSATVLLVGGVAVVSTLVRMFSSAGG